MSAAQSNSTPQMDWERRKRRRELVIALGGALLVGLIILVEHRIAGSADDIPLAGHLLLFALLSIATLLLILIIFFLIRNLFKLIFERQQRILGSHLKSRLMVAFVALTLIPTIVLFIASAGVLHTTIESWFQTQVEDSLQSSLVVAQAFYQNASDTLLQAAGRISSHIPEQWLANAADRDALVKALESWRAAEGLSSLQIYFRDESPPLIVKDPSLKPVMAPEARASLLRIGFQGEKTSNIIPLEDGADLVRAVAPVKSANSSDVTAVLVADHFIPTSLAARLFSISHAYGEYREAKRMKGPVKTIYVLMLLMVALLVIFIGSWFGMSMARDITVPIQQLAEGTGKIAAGDLSVHIEPVADDELGVLVRSFNKMTEDLRRSRDELIRVNLDLDSRRKYMETVLKGVAAGVVALDPEGKITAINDSARKLLGITEEDPLGKGLLGVLPDASQEVITEILTELASEAGDFLERQVSIAFPERSLALLCFAGSLEDEEGRDLGLVLVLDDMTHLIKAQRMAAWRDVARRIAHEIKNPLTPIQLNAQRIRRKYMPLLGEDRTVLDQCTRAIIDQVEQLKNMVNEFSTFARMPTANPMPDDLNEMIREVVDLYSQGNDRVTFSFEPDRTLPIFDLDRGQIKRAVMNLLDNAAAAVSQGGAVRVLTRYDSQLSMAVVEVVDNGSGVHPKDKDRLFEPYFSTKAGGTGLGLTIVNTIVADHNGFVRLKENEGGGARFIVELPVRKGPRSSQKPST
ncbi:MAG: HAMP domain-containing protein [Deltaproteobacteria bacterium]|nr:HAMP domain-containing protein [Deltaproteobacteria bacterium]